MRHRRVVRWERDNASDLFDPEYPVRMVCRFGLGNGAAGGSLQVDPIAPSRGVHVGGPRRGTEKRPAPPRRRGSSRSRTAAPNMFKGDHRDERVLHRVGMNSSSLGQISATAMVRKSPGHMANQGATCMYRRPSRLSRPPQLGTLSGNPKPRKLSEASVMMTAPMVMLKMTMMGASTFGSTWRSTVRQGAHSGSSSRIRG